MKTLGLAIAMIVAVVIVQECRINRLAKQVAVNRIHIYEDHGDLEGARMDIEELFREQSAM